MAQKPADELQRDAAAAAQEASQDLKNGVRNMGHEARKTMRDLSDNAGASRLVDRGAALASDAMDAGREYAGWARHEMERVVESGQQRAQEAAFYAELGYEEVSHMIRRHPTQSLALAAGIGFLVGLMIARR